MGSGFARLDFTYDGEGRRTEIVETPPLGPALTRTFRYQGDAIVQELVDGTVVRDYLTTDAGTIVKVIVPGGADAGTYHVTYDGHGDAMALWRENGDGSLTLANSYTYSTWGKPTTATHNSIGDLGFRFLYVGAYGVQWDEAGLGAELLYMRARRYDPALGRFLQPDPSRLDAQLFVYAANGPVTKVDPSGVNAECAAVNQPAFRHACDGIRLAAVMLGAVAAGISTIAVGFKMRTPATQVREAVMDINVDAWVDSTIKQLSFLSRYGFRLASEIRHFRGASVTFARGDAIISLMLEPEFGIVDGAIQIGDGHAMRSTSIEQVLRDFGISSPIGRTDLEPSLARSIAEVGQYAQALRLLLARMPLRRTR